MKGWERPEALNIDKAPTYAAAISELKAEGTCPAETGHGQVKYLNKVIDSDYAKLKALKTAYATITGIGVMRALRKCQAGICALRGSIFDEARVVEHAFDPGLCALTEAMALLKDRLANAQ